MAISILGISGSPVAGGHVEHFLEHALQSVAGDEVTVETVRLSDREVAGCRHCNWCIRKQTEERFCNIDDGMSAIYPKLVAADGVLVASPVYIGRISGQLACLLDRTRVFVHGRSHAGALRNKVGGALAVPYLRNCGAERTLTDVHAFFHTHGMIPATPSLPQLGAVAYSSLGGEGGLKRGTRHLVGLDAFGLTSAERVASRAVELIRALRTGSA